MKQRIATSESKTSLYQKLEKHYREQADKTTDPAEKQVWLQRAEEAKVNANPPTPPIP